MAFTEDLTAFFDTDEFAVLATPSGGGAAFAVIFDREHIGALGGEISANQPVALARAADASSLTANSSTLAIAGSDHHPVVVGTVTYNVRDVQPDGTGLSLIVLEKA
jgi:hypothetical protein